MVTVQGTGKMKATGVQYEEQSRRPRRAAGYECMDQQEKRKSQVWSRGRRNKRHNPCEIQQPQADHYQGLVKIHTCPCGMQNRRRRILFKVVPEAYYTNPLINLGFAIVGQSSIMST